MSDLMDAIEAYIDARIALNNMRVYQGEYHQAETKSLVARADLVSEIRKVYFNPSTILQKDGPEE